MDVDGTFLMKSTRAPNLRAPVSASFSSLSASLFLRGGQQDGDTVTSDENASADTMQHQYGTAGTGTATRESPAIDAAADQEAIVRQLLEQQRQANPNESLATSPSSLPSPILSAMAPVTAILKLASAFYLRQLTLRPVVTKSLTAGIIFGLSDWCAQSIERGASDDAAGAPAPLVPSRILTAFLVGLLFFGPAAHAWYGLVFRVLPSTSLASTLQKAALGQLFFGPAFNCVFFGAGLVQGGAFSFGAWGRKIRSDLPGVMASGMGFWPLVDFISFKVIPMQWIPLFVNFCSFVWTIYLSLVINRAKSTEG